MVTKCGFCEDVGGVVLILDCGDSLDICMDHWYAIVHAKHEDHACCSMVSEDMEIDPVN